MSSSSRRGTTKRSDKPEDEAAAAKKDSATAKAKATTDTDTQKGDPPVVAALTIPTPETTPGTKIPAGLTAPLPSRENYRTVYWSAAEKRFDQMSLDTDFSFDDDTQTITQICERPTRQFPNTHFMRRVAGHFKLGLGRNATKEAILEKICAVHYGAAFTRTAQDAGRGKRKAASGDATSSSSTLLKKRPVVMGSSRAPKRGTAAEAALKSRATALQAWSLSLDSISNSIRQTEQRLQSLCQADGGLDFYVVLMDRSKINNEYLATQFGEYDHLLDLQKQMVASMTQLGKGGGEDTATTETTLNPLRAAEVAAQAMASTGATTAEADPVEV